MSLIAFLTNVKKDISSNKSILTQMYFFVDIT